MKYCSSNRAQGPAHEKQHTFTTRTRRLSRFAILPLAAGLAIGLSAFSAPQAQAATQYCNGCKAPIVGTNDNDDIEGTSGRDVSVGLGGHDEIDGKGGNEICAGSGNDEVDGGSGNDYIHGGSGHDLVGGGPGSDTVSGGAGTDTVT